VKKQLPIWPVVSVALVIVALVAYFILIRPKRAEAGRLSDQIAQLETQVRTAKLASRPSDAGKKIKVADLFELTKAMPDRDDMPGIILELNSVAEAAGISFKAIAPQNQVNAESYRVLPISLTFEGNYYDLTDFLFRMRNLVSVQDGKLAAAGRFFTLDSLDMHPATGGLPRIEAILVVSAYVFDSSSHSTVLAPVLPPPTTGTTTGATTTPVGSGAVGGLG
jgi:type IV pilus assembly protein PilO